MNLMCCWYISHEHEVKKYSGMEVEEEVEAVNSVYKNLGQLN